MRSILVCTASVENQKTVVAPGLALCSVLAVGNRPSVSAHELSFARRRKPLTEFYTYLKHVL